MTGAPNRNPAAATITNPHSSRVDAHDQSQRQRLFHCYSTPDPCDQHCRSGPDIRHPGPRPDRDEVTQTIDNVLRGWVIGYLWARPSAATGSSSNGGAPWPTPISPVSPGLGTTAAPAPQNMPPWPTAKGHSADCGLAERTSPLPSPGPPQRVRLSLGRPRLPTQTCAGALAKCQATYSWDDPDRHLSVIRRIPVIVATLSVSGGWDGTGSTSATESWLSEKQQRFVRLIAQGVSNAEACRRVGINRRTGTRWRFGRTVRNTAGACSDAVEAAPSSVGVVGGAEDDVRSAPGEKDAATDRAGDRPVGADGQSGAASQTLMSPANIFLIPRRGWRLNGCLGRARGGWLPMPSFAPR
jgi:Homeodomain-like domain